MRLIAHSGPGDPFQRIGKQTRLHDDVGIQLDVLILEGATRRDFLGKRHQLLGRTDAERSRSRTGVAVNVLERAAVEIEPGSVVDVGFSIGGDGESIAFKHALGQERSVLFQFSLVGRFDVLPVHVFGAHRDLLILMIERNMDGGAMAGPIFQTVVLSRIGFGDRGIGIHRVGISDVEGHRLTDARGGHGQGVEHELFAHAGSRTGRARNPHLGIHLLILRLGQGRHAGRLLVPDVFDGHLLQHHVAHHGLDVGRLVVGRKAGDVHHHAHVGQGVIEVELGHRTARLGQFVGVVSEQQVVGFDALV